jgi:hypothetical protein
MQARVTQFEIDTLRTSLDSSLELFKQSVLPRLREQPGCMGAMALATPEGSGLLISFWTDTATATAAEDSGFYDEQLARFMVFLRQPPGKQRYEVMFHELDPAFSAGAAVGGRQP